MNFNKKLALLRHFEKLAADDIDYRRRMGQAAGVGAQLSGPGSIAGPTIRQSFGYKPSSDGSALTSGGTRPQRFDEQFTPGNAKGFLSANLGRESFGSDRQFQVYQNYRQRFGNLSGGTSINDKKPEISRLSSGHDTTKPITRERSVATNRGNSSVSKYRSDRLPDSGSTVGIGQPTQTSSPVSNVNHQMPGTSEKTTRGSPSHYSFSNIIQSGNVLKNIGMTAMKNLFGIGESLPASKPVASKAQVTSVDKDKMSTSPHKKIEDSPKQSYDDRKAVPSTPKVQPYLYTPPKENARDEVPKQRINPFPQASYGIGAGYYSTYAPWAPRN